MSKTEDRFTPSTARSSSIFPGLLATTVPDTLAARLAGKRSEWEWKSPKMAAILGIIQFSLALLILLLQKFQLGLNSDTLFVILDYSFWAVLAALFFNRFQSKESKD